MHLGASNDYEGAVLWISPQLQDNLSKLDWYVLHKTGDDTTVCTTMVQAARCKWSWLRKPTMRLYMYWMGQILMYVSELIQLLHTSVSWHNTLQRSLAVMWVIRILLASAILPRPQGRPYMYHPKHPTATYEYINTVSKFACKLAAVAPSCRNYINPWKDTAFGKYCTSVTMASEWL